MTNSEYKQQIKELRVKKIKSQIENFEAEASSYKARDSAKKTRWQQIVPHLPLLFNAIPLVLTVYLLKTNDSGELAQGMKKLAADEDKLANERNAYDLKVLEDKRSSLDTIILFQDATIKNKNDSISALSESYNVLSTKSAELFKLTTGRRDTIRNMKDYVFSTTVVNYLNSIFYLTDPEMKDLVKRYRLKVADRPVIQRIISENYYRRPNPNNYQLIQNVKISALEYICSLKEAHYEKFQFYVLAYIKVMAGKEPGYNNQVLDLLINPVWTDDRKADNLNYFVYESIRHNGNNKISQIADWATYLIGEKSLKNKAFPFIPAIHQYLLNQCKKMLVNQPLSRQEVEFLKADMLSLFRSCPQCYLAMESEIIYLSINELSKINFQDTISLSFKLDPMGEIFVGPVSIGFAKVSTIINPEDLRVKYPDLYKIHRDMNSINRTPKFSDFQGKADLSNYRLSFLQYYNQNKERFAYWLSEDRSLELAGTGFREAMEHLKL